MQNSLAYFYTHSVSPSFANNTYLRYRLASINGVGMSAYSTTTILTARSPLPPSAPTIVFTTYNSIKIQWALITDYDQSGRDTITNYKVQYNSNPFPNLEATYPWVDIATVSAATSQYTYSISSPFPTYTNRSEYDARFRVLALNGVGWGMTSNDLYVETCTYPRQ